jgi:hypothetical protein
MNSYCPQICNPYMFGSSPWARSQAGYGSVSTGTTCMGRSDIRRYTWI